MWYSVSDPELNFNPGISLQFGSPTGQTKIKVMLNQCKEFFVGCNVRSFLLVAKTVNNVIHCLKYYAMVNHKLLLLLPFIYEPLIKRMQQGPLFERSLSWGLPFGSPSSFIVKRGLHVTFKSYWILCIGLLENRFYSSELKWSCYKLYF